MAGTAYGPAAPCATHNLDGTVHFDEDLTSGAAVPQTITGRFASAARRTPSAIALVEDDAEITYAELDERSNALSRYLRRRGIGRGELVALLGGRSISTLTAVLAVLKAGAGYVPLDESYPAGSLRFMVADCAPALVLGQTRLLANRDLGVTATDFDTAFAAAVAESRTPLEDAAQPGDPAYVMYTSGSTGRPKGVIVPHRAVVRLVTGQSYLRFGADEVFLHAAPLAFDASTLEIWGALLHGARLAVVASARPSLQDIADTIRRHNVTTAWFTAGLFHLLVEQRLDDLRPLRQLIAGGDVLSPTHVLRALDALPECRLVNGYGPTENTTFTCCHEITRDGWSEGSVPIGTPIAHTYVRILDDDLKPVADGDAGQLCAGGSGLALGYLGDARRSAERFVPDPYAPGAILYLTGDLARRRSDGALEFIGRRDRQIKIDGKRVELGEIEEALRRDPAVTDALVIMREDRAEARRLIGYVKLKPAAGQASAFGRDALDRLRREVPAHMMPSEIVTLDAFPLTPNGKVDIARLPAPQAKEAVAFAAAADALEGALSEIFKRVLRSPGVGMDSNFFDLGATSLNLLEAHEAIVRACGDVDFVALFEHPNIRGLAAFLRGREATKHQHDAAQARMQRQSDALSRLRAARLAQ